MKALQVTGLNKIEIREIVKEAPRPGEALVKMHAAALNHRDQWIRAGKYPNIQYQTTLGSDGCGEVVDVGGDEGTDLIGKLVLINPNVAWGPNPECQSSSYQVLGMPTNGTLAEFITIPVNRLVEKPQHLEPYQAAALPLAGLTAYRALFRHGKLDSNNEVLITGIGGGVSQMAFLFASAIGASVSVTSGDREKLKKMRQMGAVHTYNYREEWDRSALANHISFDLVIDSAGGDQLNKLVNLTKPGGTIVFYGATTGLPAKLDLYRMFWNQITLQGSTMGNDEEFKEMISFVDTHQLVPVVDSQRSFENVLEAFDKMSEAQQLGKLVVTFD
jgi:NADPH:quinone reductase-like Zn-dependent oxidoreductase